MKLKASIERGTTRWGKNRFVKLTFPVGKIGHPIEKTIERNIGPRPWSKISYWENGRNIIIYSK